MTIYDQLAENIQPPGNEPTFRIGPIVSTTVDQVSGHINVLTLWVDLGSGPVRTGATITVLDYLWALPLISSAIGMHAIVAFIQGAPMVVGLHGHETPSNGAALDRAPAGVLFSSDNVAPHNYSANGPIVGWDGASITLTSTRRIQIIQTGYWSIDRNVVASIVLSNTIGSLNLSTAHCFTVSGATGGTDDMNRVSQYGILGAGTYGLSSTIAFYGTAAVVSLAGVAILQIVDLGAA